MLSIGFTALQNGDPVLAERIGRQFLATAPDNEGGLLLLALGLDAQERGEESLRVFERIATLFPRCAEHWTNLGNIQRRLGHDDQACSSYRRSLQLDPDQVDALQNLGLIQYERGLFIGARRDLLAALNLRPHDAALRLQTASALHETGDTDGARELLHDWQHWAAAEAEVLVDIAALYNEMGDLAIAEDALRRAETLRPGNIRAAMRRVTLLERSNRIDEARVALSQVSAETARQAGLLDDFLIATATLAARGDDIDEACRLHEALLSNRALAARRPTLFHAIARLNDQRGRPDEAMRWIQQGHEVQIAQLRIAAPEKLSAASNLTLAQRRITQQQYAQWPAIQGPEAAQSPVFVVGFPRSGTTLLETLLDAHEELTCMDERTFLDDLTKQIEADGITYPEQLGALDARQCQQLRDKYWNLVYTRTNAVQGKRLIDKNPLNMMRLPVIARLFPHAKIVLCLRDPRDVVLSNYLQMFRAPAYAIMCSSMTTTAEGYATAIDFWLDQAAVFQPDVHTLRLEDLVDDLEGCARRLCAFLDLPWSPAMAEFHQHALQRGYIRTPSYHQVIEPVNRKGIGRWRRYQEWIEPALPCLAPHLERFGYARD
ncbi:MAG: sulfotransferase [Rhodanobacteraceae bacterium]|nr:sulfotransferase [Rhodanobacteraceae bacterium]